MAQQTPASAESQAQQLDQIVSQYLRKKGYIRAELTLKEEAGLQSIEGLAHNLNLLTDLNVANYIMFYNPNEQYPSIWSDSYAGLKEWVESSLDMYKVRPCALLLSSLLTNNPLIQPELMAILFPVFVHCYLDLVEKSHSDAGTKNAFPPSGRAFSGFA